MLSVAIAALRSRRSQNVALMLLACLVVAGVVGAPFYVYAAVARVVSQDLVNARASQQRVTMSEQIAIGQRGADGVNQSLAVMRSQLDLPGTVEITGIRIQGSVARSIGLNVPVADRDEVCDHVVLQGACPSGDHDAMVSTTTAAQLKLRVGETIPWPGPEGTTIPTMTIVGIYQPRDVTDPYWGGSLLVATRDSVGPIDSDAIFVTRGAMTTFGLDVTFERILIMRPADFTVARADLIGSRVRDAGVTGPSKGLSVTTDATSLTDRVDADSQQLMTTIPILAGEIVALGWFALFLVVRASALNRGADAGLVRLRGVPRRTAWSMMAAQSAIPVVTAVPIGTVVGYFAARWLAGDIRSESEQRLAIAFAAGGVVLVVLGTLIASAIAERRGRKTPILDMFRQTPPRRRGWRSDVVDVVVLALAIIGIVQGRSGSDPSSGGLVMLTPALVALAVGLIVGRALSPISTRIAGRMVRAGRPTGMLTVTYLARRPGLDRIFALLVIAVALAGNAVVVWHVADSAQDARAEQEVGAHRVMAIRGVSPAQVMAVTHAVDPAGRYAMAAAELTSGNSPDQSVLAVDSPRLAAVLPSDGPALTRLLRPVAPSGITVTGDLLRLTVDGVRLGAKKTYVFADLAGSDGVRHYVPFGPLSLGSREYSSPLTGCVGGCRLIGFEPGGKALMDGTAGPVPAGGVALVLENLNGAYASDFANRYRWRTSFGIDTIGPALAIDPNGLAVDLPATDSYADGSSVNAHVFLSDVPVPAPIVIAGKLPDPGFGGIVTIKPFGEALVPVDVAGTRDVLPRLGRAGSYIDLDYALRLNTASEVLSSPEIWLNSDTPASVIAALRSSGLIISRDTTTAAALAIYRDQGPEAGRRFALLIAALGVILAGIALLLVAAVERKPRAAEMTALRRQGVSRRTVAVAVVSGYLWLAGTALAVGFGAVVLDLIVTAGRTREPGSPTDGSMIFADGWQVLSPPSAFGAVGWLIATVVVGVPILGVAFVAGRQLERGITTRGQAVAP